jgi:hypothetical protein
MWLLTFSQKLAIIAARDSVSPTVWKALSVWPYRRKDSSRDSILRPSPMSAQLSAPNFEIVMNTNTCHQNKRAREEKEHTYHNLEL